MQPPKPKISVPAEPKKPLISASDRYVSAWSEICARLTIRSNFNNYHVAAITALAAVHFSIKEDNLSHRTGVAVAIPLVSALFVMWYRHNDYIIGALSAYCRFFEEDDFAQKCPFPSWFYAPSREGSIQFYVLSFRDWSDYATAVICSVSPVLALYDIYFYSSLKFEAKENIPPMTVIYLYTGAVICILLSGYLVYIMLNISKNRGKILTEAKYDSRTGFWTLPPIK